MATRLYWGLKLPSFKAGDRKVTAFSASTMNGLVDAQNAFLSSEIRRGPTYSVIVSDKNIVFQIARDTGGTSPTPTIQAKRMRVKGIFADYLSCKELTNDGS